MYMCVCVCGHCIVRPRLNNIPGFPAFVHPPETAGAQAATHIAVVGSSRHLVNGAPDFLISSARYLYNNKVVRPGN